MILRGVQSLAIECREEAHFQFALPGRILLQEEKNILLGIAGAVKHGEGAAVRRSLQRKRRVSMIKALLLLRLA